MTSLNFDTSSHNFAILSLYLAILRFSDLKICDNTNILSSQFCEKNIKALKYNKYNSQLILFH